VCAPRSALVFSYNLIMTFASLQVERSITTDPCDNRIIVRAGHRPWALHVVS
jgi:hypothetical protein